MSREIRRVPLDFDFPCGETWSGYLTDEFDFPSCPDCFYVELPTLMSRLFPDPGPSASGLTPSAYAISQSFYPHMIGGPMAEQLAWCNKIGQAEVDHLLAEGRLIDFSHRWNPETSKWEPRDVKVTAAMVNANRFAHDAINHSLLVRFRCQQLGIEVSCPTCEGHGSIATEEQRQAADDWEGTEPPTGPGYQLWQTVSEGGPVSPVFATPEGLATWIRDYGTENDGRNTPYEGLVAWVRDEGSSVGSFAMVPGRGMVSGVELAAEVVSGE